MATTITTATGLQNMANNLAEDYVLGGNIDASATSGWNGGLGFTPVGTSATKFTGTFDGAGYTISDLYINRSDIKYVGLFGYTNGATIQDVTLSVDITTGYGSSGDHAYVGGLVGAATDTSITGCVASGVVTATSRYSLGTGMLAGYASSSAAVSLSNCSSSGTVTQSGAATPSNVGGLAGTYNGSNVTISGCHSSATVSATNANFVGGLFGVMNLDNDTDEMTNCYATGAVTGNSRVGGLVGRAWNAYMKSCYATGAVDASGNYSGGLIGNLSTDTSTILRCYSTGSVTSTGNDVGGLIGYIYISKEGEDSVVQECYASGNVSGVDKVGGFVGTSTAGYYPNNASKLSLTISNCYSTGSVTASASSLGTGGFVGANGEDWGGGDTAYGSDINNCYSVGAITATGSNIGGFAGEGTAYSGTIATSFWDTETSGQASSDGGTGKTTAQMKTKSTFTDAAWNFVTTWFISVSYNSGYPSLVQITSDATTNVLFTVGPDWSPYYTAGKYLIYNTGTSTWDINSGSRLFRAIGTGTSIGYIWIEGTELHFINANGVEVNLADSDLYILKSLFDANTILAADTDDTPAALTINEERIVGRKTGGVITGLTGAEVTVILRRAPTTITTNTTLSDEDVVLCDCTSGDITVTLPASASNSGKEYSIKKIDSSRHKVTIDPNGTETIDGKTTLIIDYRYNSPLICSDATNWILV